MKRLALMVCVLALAGCQTARTNVKWYNPGTWFSGSEGRAVNRAEQQVDTRKAEALGAAQVAAHKAQSAIAKLPSGVEQAVAADFAGEVVVLLDQVIGPPKFGDLTMWQQQVDRLCSSDAAVRAKAELERAEQKEQTAKLSRKLQEAEASLSAKTGDLAEAFKRENALANELRNQRWWKWFILISVGLVALLASGGYIYIRYFFGGIPGGILKTVTGTLDKVYEAGGAETQQWMDDNIFQKLSDKMTTKQKATVHRIRAVSAT
jgi:hypothetical protein